MPDLTLHARTLGCLLGGAVGDALGAPYEGLWGDLLPQGPELFAEFAEFEGYPRGQFTDDTQLTLATVEAILSARDVDGAAIATRIAGLWTHESVIGPGGACTRAAHAFLRGADWRSCGAPVGNAGNGTAMRMAVLGLVFLRDPAALPAVAADVARITHHDPRSVAGGVGVAQAALLLASGQPPDERWVQSVASSMEPFHAPFAELVRTLPSVLHGSRAEAEHWIAWCGHREPELERPIVTPFVIPTLLACLAAALRHPDSWTDAVGYALRLGGDVDTTGAITGGLLGARLGVAAIPPHLAAGVVDAERLRALGTRLARWIERVSP